MMILLQVAPDIENQYQHGFSKDRSKGAPVKYYQLLQVLRKPDSPRDVRPSVRPSAPRPPVRLVGRPSDRFFWSRRSAVSVNGCFKSRRFYS